MRSLFFGAFSGVALKQGFTKSALRTSPPTPPQQSNVIGNVLTNIQISEISCVLIYIQMCGTRLFPPRSCFSRRRTTPRLRTNSLFFTHTHVFRHWIIYVNSREVGASGQENTSLICIPLYPVSILLPYTNTRTFVRCPLLASAHVRCETKNILISRARFLA